MYKKENSSIFFMWAQVYNSVILIFYNFSGLTVKSSLETSQLPLPLERTYQTVRLRQWLIV